MPVDFYQPVTPPDQYDHSITGLGTPPTWLAETNRGAGVVPTGAILDFAGTTAPTGYLLCDGSAVSRGTHQGLFAIIGTAYGPGDGSTTFNVPDLRGRISVCRGSHADVQTVGANDGVALANRRPKHNHTVSNSLTLTGAPGVGSLSTPNHSHLFHMVEFYTAGSVHGNTTGGATYTGSGTEYDSDWAMNGAGGGPVQGAPSAGSLGIAGTVAVGPAGTNPGDSPAYLVVNKIIKTG